MIVNSSSKDDMSVRQPHLGAPPQDSPPSYDFATESGSAYSPEISTPNLPLIPSSPKALVDYRQPLMPQGMASGPSYTVQPSYTSPPTVYNYINPSTGEQVVSLLPPSHPEMICLQSGGHVPQTHYGLLGVLAAIFWFPLGIGLCLLDKRVRCERCGLAIEDGFCG